MTLSRYPVGAAVAVTDIARARAFYEEKLGLEVGTDSGENIRYVCAGDTAITVFSTPHAGGSTATQAGWGVQDIDSVVDELTARGVEFDQIQEGPIQTDEKGIASFDGGGRVAFFRDPDGNVLSLAQAPPGFDD
jgi:catechol 2,3-dioxygenase-like lactoylglutathione lyase family enzyme